MCAKSKIFHRCRVWGFLYIYSWVPTFVPPKVSPLIFFLIKIEYVMKFAVTQFIKAANP